MKKRGQGLPLNTIIIAILVLIVLVAVVAIFTTQMFKTENNLDNLDPSFVEAGGDCNVVGNEETGECKASCGDGETELKGVPENLKRCKPGLVCCVSN